MGKNYSNLSSRESSLVRFWSSVKLPFDATNNDCWVWIGNTNTGYGRMSHEGSIRYAHVVSYILYKGSVRDLCVLHTCDNTSCVNPNHLILGTHQENMADMCRKGRKKKGDEASITMIPFSEVLFIRQSYKQGISSKELSQRYDCSQRYIMQLVNFQRRKDC